MLTKLNAIALAAAFVGLASARADAALDYWIEGVLDTINLVDEVNNGGTGQSLDLTFKEGYSGKFCNANTGYGGPGGARIPSDSTPLFDHYVRTAQAALLAGKTVRIHSHSTTTSLAQCKIRYMQVKP